MEFGTPQFWVAAMEIIVINILLSGDNAVVIALACRNLPPKQRTLGIFYGVIGAVVLRVLLTFFAVSLLKLPYLQLVGAALLVWIGIGTTEPERMYQGVHAFHDALTQAGIKHVYWESPGTAHEWLTWRRDLHEFAPLLFR